MWKLLFAPQWSYCCFFLAGTLVLIYLWKKNTPCHFSYNKTERFFQGLNVRLNHEPGVRQSIVIPLIYIKTYTNSFYCHWSCNHCTHKSNVLSCAIAVSAEPFEYRTVKASDFSWSTLCTVIKQPTLLIALAFFSPPQVIYYSSRFILSLSMMPNKHMFKIRLLLTNRFIDINAALNATPQHSTAWLWRSHSNHITISITVWS